MKQKTVKMLCAISMSAVLLTGTMPAMASETETAAAVSAESTETAAASETETETVSGTETETASETETAAGEETEETGTSEDQAVKYPDVEVEAKVTAVAITNESDMEIVEAEVSEESEEGTVTLTLKDVRGGEHVFLEADLADMEEPVLRKNGSFLAIGYHSLAEDSETEIVEEGEEITYDEPVTMLSLIHI